MSDSGPYERGNITTESTGDNFVVSCKLTVLPNAFRLLLFPTEHYRHSVVLLHIGSFCLYGAMQFMCCHLASHFEYKPFTRHLFLAIVFRGANMTSSTKPEVHNVSQRRQKRTEHGHR